MSLRLKFIIKLLADYHISSGISSEIAVDSVLVRDPNGLPKIQGSTLSGLFRTAGLELIKFEPQYAMKLKPYFETIFGINRRLKNWAFRSAEMQPDEALRMEIGTEKFANVRTGVRIDPNLRRAQDAKLFMKEFGSAGSEFVFFIEHIGDNGSEKDEAAFLVAAARLIRSIGSNINRGAGKCLISLSGIEGIMQAATQEDMLQHLHCMLNEKQKRSAVFESIPKELIPSQEITTVRLVMQTVEPVIVGSGGKDGTEYDTLPYIPGTVLVGAFARKYIKQFGISGDEYRNFIEMFKRNALLFSPLYPVQYGASLRNLIPTVPIPQDMLSCKHKPNFTPYRHTEQVIKGYACDEDIPTDGCQFCNGVPLVNNEGFLPVKWRDEENVVKTELKNIYEPHLAMMIEERRALDENFYAYNTIPAGTLFYGEIEAESQEYMTKLLKLLEQDQDNKGFQTELLIGKGITRGYGKVKVHLDALPAPMLNPLPLNERVHSLDGITLCFISDTILTDTWGRCIASFDDEVLSGILSPLKVKVIQSFIALKEIEGFNGKTGLPRFRDMAIKAGSAVGFNILGETIDKARTILEEFEKKRLGFRVNEGFGLISFNHVIYRMKDFADKLRSVQNPFYDIDGQNDNVIWPKILIHLQLKYLKKSHLPSEFDRNFARWLHQNRTVSIVKLKENLALYGTFQILNDGNIKGRSKQSKIGDFLKMADQEIDNLKKIVAMHVEDFNPEESQVEIWVRTIEWFAAFIVANEEMREKHG